MNTATFSASTRADPTTGKLNWQSRFASLPHAVLLHPSFQELSGGPVKLLLALLAGYIGKNNGHLTATHSRMKTFGFNSKESLAKGLRELIARGYIVRTRAQRLRSPALYAITWLPINPPAFGMQYDPGVVPGDESLDLWRSAHHSDLATAA